MKDLAISVPAFDSLTYQGRKQMSSLFKKVEFLKDSYLIEEGKPLKYAYIIKSGDIGLTRNSNHQLTEARGLTSPVKYPKGPLYESMGCKKTTKEKLKETAGYQTKTFQTLQLKIKTKFQWVGFEAILDLNEYMKKKNTSSNTSLESDQQTEDDEFPVYKNSAQVYSSKAVVYRIKLIECFNQGNYIRNALLKSAKDQMKRTESRVTRV